jgi:hypothetical protein
MAVLDDEMSHVEKEGDDDSPLARAYRRLEGAEARLLEAIEERRSAAEEFAAERLKLGRRA